MHPNERFSWIMLEGAPAVCVRHIMMDGRPNTPVEPTVKTRVKDR